MPPISHRAAVSMGNHVAHFIVTSALITVLYQVVAADWPLPSTISLLESSYRKCADSWHFSSSEITSAVVTLGLVVLLQHKTNRNWKPEFEAEAKQKQRIRNTEKQCRGFKVEVLVPILPRDVFHELLLFLSPKDLAVCPLVSKSWELNAGDAADMLWRRVFQRDFGEPGDRFAQVFPIACWRQFYFRHHLSRAVELARVLGSTQDRKCVVIKGHVYDVTDFLDLHPGGVHVIGDAVGTDATVIWDQFGHSNEARESMQQFLVHDHVLERPKREQLQGNLVAVTARWQMFSWALSHSYCFGHMAIQVATALFCFRSRGVSVWRQSRS